MCFAGFTLWPVCAEKMENVFRIEVWCSSSRLSIGNYVLKTKLKCLQQDLVKITRVSVLYLYRHTELLSQTWVDGLQREAEDEQTTNGNWIPVERLSIECRKQFAPALVLFYCALWLAKKTGVTFSTNEIITCSRAFPALGTGYTYLIRVLIGSLQWLRQLWLTRATASPFTAVNSKLL